MRHLLIATLAAGIGLAAASPLSAQPSLRIGYADLDLRSPQGIATLDRRVARAAARLCSEATEFDLAQAMAARACRRTVTARIAPIRDAAIARAADLRVADAAPR